MKKSWILLLIFMPCFLKAQIFADGKNLNEIPDLEYICVRSYIFGGLLVEYEANQRFYSHQAKNEAGEKLKFSNTILFLNYFYKKGWELQTMRESDDYIFRRRKP